MSIFASIIRRKMRLHHVTIRALAASMCVTMKRVREVRNHGTPPSWATVGNYWQRDWLDGIRKAADERAAP